MKIQLTEQQKKIINNLLSRSIGEYQKVLGELEQGRLAMADIEGLCTVINNEFLMEGILPNFEPNTYGLELEALLDIVNKVRINS